MIRPLALAAAASLLAACTPFEFAEQDISIRHDAEADVIELDVVTRGIFGTSTGQSSPRRIDERAAALIRQMAEGRRYLHLLSWPFVVDRDRERDEDEDLTKEDVPPDWISIAETWDDLAGGVTVTDAHTFLDDRDEVGVVQRVRVERAGEILRSLNETIDLMLVDLIEQSNGTDTPDEAFSSAAAHALLLEFARGEGDWVSLDADGLTIRCPMTPTDRARLLRDMLDLGGSDSDRDRRGLAFVRALTDGLSSISAAGDVVVLRYEFDEDDRVTLRYAAPRHPDAKRLVVQFEEDELVRREH